MNDNSHFAGVVAISEIGGSGLETLKIPAPAKRPYNKINDEYRIQLLKLVIVKFLSYR